MLIQKIGAIILNDNGQMLVVRKQVPGRCTFIIPGGKPEIGETDQETCARELREELAIHVRGMHYFGSFEEPSEFEDATVKATVYTVDVVGQPRPCNEIVELAWVDGSFREYGFDLGSILSRHVIPKLILDGVISPGGASVNNA